MIEHDDQDLQERFAALRREDAASMPAFAATVAAARARRTTPVRGRLVVLGTGAALAAVALIVMVRWRDRQRAPIDLATVRLHGPTDFLLKIPGEDLLRVVPRFTMDGRLSR